MKEIEVKILEVDKEEIVKKLLALGAKKIFDAELCSLVFDYDDHRIKNRKDVLRLRKDSEKSVLTYKKFIGNDDVKVLEEIEFEVEDFNKTKELLESLGLKITLTVVKHRISYELNKVKFEFDKHLEEHAHIPLFLEIEAPNKEELYTCVKLLGFSEEDCRSWGFGKILKHYSF